MAIEDEFRVRVVEDAGGPVLHVHGELDLAARDLLTEAIEGVRARDHAVVVDLAEVTFIDSGGLQAILQAYADEREAGRELVVRRPSDAVRRMLDMTGIAPALRIETAG